MISGERPVSRRSDSERPGARGCDQEEPLNAWNRLGRRGNLHSHFKFEVWGEFVRYLETGRPATDSGTFLVACTFLLRSNGHYVCKISPSLKPHLKTVSPSLLDPATFRVLSELFTKHAIN